MRNKRAYYDFEILDHIECGIVLTGEEVKAIRSKNIGFNDSFIRIKNNHLYMHNLFIASYHHRDTSYPYDGQRVRTLLAHKKEIRKLNRAVTQKGATLIPLDLHLSRGNLIKITVATAKGKRKFDKKEAIKRSDLAREVTREIKNYQR